MKKTIKLIIFVFGVLVGLQLGSSIVKAPYAMDKLGFFLQTPTKTIIFEILISVLFGFIFVLFIPPILKRQEKFVTEFLSGVKNISVFQIIIIALGLILGLVLAALICVPIKLLNLPEWINTILTVVIYAASIYVSITITMYKLPDIISMLKDTNVNRENLKLKPMKKQKINGGKILDTSVIIDGRIYDILKTGFVDGPIVIPEFVLFELQTIADSTDGIKRNRGRRGLDILNKIQNELDIEVIITDKDYHNITEVDTKLLRLAADTNGKVVTNDYNLNKIAEFQGVTVLNTNELTNAVKTLVLPGEEMYVKVLREGKEHSQGIAYLEDGTMIVVEEGRNYIGQDINTVVTSVLQTAAGRMIFVKPA